MGIAAVEKNNPGFHLHAPHPDFHHHVKKDVKYIPKGCLAIWVGHEGEEQQRFVIPIIYFNHPLFIQLLQEAEEEYGFDHRGAITIPCQVEEFRTVQEMIDKEESFHHHHHPMWCFRV